MRADTEVTAGSHRGERHLRHVHGYFPRIQMAQNAQKQTFKTSPSAERRVRGAECPR